MGRFQTTEKHQLNFDLEAQNSGQNLNLRCFDDVDDDDDDNDDLGILFDDNYGEIRTAITSQVINSA